MPDTTIAVPALVVLLPLGIALALFAVRHARTSAQTRWDAAWTAAAALYGLLVLDVTLFPMTLMLGATGNQAAWWSQVNAVPLLTADPPTFARNVILFTPLGALLTVAARRFDLRAAVLMGFACSTAVEIVQLTLNVCASTGRSADVNDVIANTTGAILGSAITRPLARLVLRSATTRTPTAKRFADTGG